MSEATQTCQEVPQGRPQNAAGTKAPKRAALQPRPVPGDGDLRAVAQTQLGEDARDGSWPRRANSGRRANSDICTNAPVFSVV